MEPAARTRDPVLAMPAWMRDAADTKATGPHADTKARFPFCPVRASSSRRESRGNGARLGFPAGHCYFLVLRPCAVAEETAVVAGRRLRAQAAALADATSAATLSTPGPGRDEETAAPIDDASRVRCVESRLRHVVHDGTGGDRRLHQLLNEDGEAESRADQAEATAVAVQDWGERGYSVVTVSCRDRPKLLFDVVCTLTDLDYVVYHGTFDTDGDHAQQEFYIRRLDGRPISSAAERRRVIQCLQAAIERRASEGVRLELRITDRRGLLAYVTRVFRENSLSVTHAEITTRGDMAMNVFHVTDAAGRPADPKTIDEVIQRIGTESLRVDEERWPRLCSTAAVRGSSRSGAL